MSISLAIVATVPAYPLGQPVDGRKRYGMTPEQAAVYRWLVKHRSHTEPFVIHFREIARIMASHPSSIHERVKGLRQRGWISKTARDSYMLVHPVMTFKAPRDAA
jgi:DNA-binding MarR family transcriptional regulator